MLKHNKILVFDFETNGLDPINSQVIEVGAILLEKEKQEYKISSEINLLVKTDEPLPEIIKNLTNITDEMLIKDGVSEYQAFETLMNLIDDQTLLIAYNAAFDLSFLIYMHKKFNDINFKLKNDILDVMAVYKDRYPYPHKLDNAVETYNVQVKNTHRALDDVLATFGVLCAMNNEKANLETYVNVLGFNPKFGFRGPFLKHVKAIGQKGGLLEIEKNT